MILLEEKCCFDVQVLGGCQICPSKKKVWCKGGQVLSDMFPDRSVKADQSDLHGV